MKTVEVTKTNINTVVNNHNIKHAILVANKPAAADKQEQDKLFL